MKSVKPFGNVKNPEAVIVLPYLEGADWEKKKLLSGVRGRILKDVLGDRINKVCVTSLVKTAEFKDKNIEAGLLKKPSQKTLEKSRIQIWDELDEYKAKTVIPLGNECLKLLDGKDLKIGEVAGQFKKITKGERTYRFIPNYDPIATVDNNKIMSTFRQCIDKALAPDPEKYQRKCKEIILPFEDAVIELKQTRERYMDGEINYMGFDIETTDFIPAKGDIIMYSFAHTAKDVGYSIPLITNNRIDHKGYEHIPRVDVKYSEREVYKLNEMLGRVLKDVPITGHNIKFDVKWIAEKGIIPIQDLRIHGDTMLFAFQIYSKVAGQSLALDALCEKCLGISWKDEVKEYLKKYKRVADRHYGNLPTGLLAPYACKDAFYHIMLFEYLDKLMPKDMRDLAQIFSDATLPFADIERVGLSVDWEMFEFLKDKYETVSKEYLQEVMDLPVVERFIFDLVYPRLKLQKKNPRLKQFTFTQLRDEGTTGSKAFSLGSPDQIRMLMYNEKYYNLIVDKKKKKLFFTKSKKLATDKKVVKWYRENYLDPDAQRAFLKKKRITKEQYNLNREAKTFLDNYVKWKRIAGKLLPTYVYPVPERSPNGLYRPEYNINGTVTMRASCLIGSTKLPLLNGEITEIGSLKKGDTGWILGCESDGTVVPCKFTALGQTKKVNTTYRIILDNDDVVETTECHRFMLRDGTYKKAKELVENESLMPTYTFLEKTGYLKVVSGCKGDRHWEYIHKLVAKDMGLDESKHTHHIDENKLNNCPDNLEAISKSDHLKLHANRKWKNKKYRSRMEKVLKENNKSNWSNPDYVEKMNKARQHSTNPTALAKISKKSKECWKSDEYRRKIETSRLRNMLTSLNRKVNSYEEFLSEIKKAKEDGRVKPKARSYFPEDLYNEVVFNNHKIKKIEIITHKKPIAVYDIHVPRTNNFVVANEDGKHSIFVHNSGFHTIDQHSEIPRFYKSRWSKKGGLFLAPDFSTLELRIVAALANEKGMLDAFKNGEDLHRKTAAKVFGVPEKRITHEQRQAGKCVDPNTWVYANHQYKRIGSLFSKMEDDTFYKPKDYLSVAIDEYSTSLVKNLYSNGEAKRLLVCSRRGLLACSERHRFLLEDGTLKKAKDLKKGDILKDVSIIHKPSGFDQKVPFNPLHNGKKPNSLFNISITDDLSYVLGMFLGDGCSHKTFVEICSGASSKYSSWRKEIKKALTKVGFTPKLKKIQHKESGSCVNTYFGSTNVVNILRDLGVIDEYGRKDLRIPDYILNASEGVRYSFLAGLVDTDGSADKYGSIEITTKSWVLAQDITMLCASLGMRYSVDPCYNKTYKRYYYRLRISKYFCQELKPFLRYKEKRDKITKPFYEKKPRERFKNEVQVIIPLEKSKLVDLEIEHEDHLYLTNGLTTHNTLNFFTLYGGGPESLADSLKITKKEAEKYLKTFFETYPNLKPWLRKQIKFVKSHGYLQTIFGGRIPIPEIYSEDKWMVAEAERWCGNYPVQHAAGVSAIWCVNQIWRELKERKMKSLVVGTVHDSVEIDSYPTELFENIKMIKRICEKELPDTYDWITCPLKMGFDMGYSWGGSVEFEVEKINDKKLVLVGEGMRKDILRTLDQFEKVYDTDYEILETKELTEDDFSAETFVKDFEEWKCKITLLNN